MEKKEGKKKKAARKEKKGKINEKAKQKKEATRTTKLHHTKLNHTKRQAKILKSRDNGDSTGFSRMASGTEAVNKRNVTEHNEQGRRDRLRLSYLGITLFGQGLSLVSSAGGRRKR